MNFRRRLNAFTSEGVSAEEVADQILDVVQ